MAEFYFPELPDIPVDPEGDSELLKLFYREEKEAWHATQNLRYSVNPMVDGLGLAKMASKEPNAEIAAYLNGLAADSIADGFVEYHKRLDAACEAVEALRTTLEKMRRI